MRKIVSLPAQLAKDIDDYRFAQRISTEAEAIRRLIGAGLQAHRASDRGRMAEPMRTQSTARASTPRGT